VQVHETQSPRTVRVLAIDQAGEAGGAQLCLLDLAGGYDPDEMTVFLLSDGPFRKRLANTGLQVVAARAPGSFVTVPRRSNVLGMMRGVGGMLALGREAARLARKHDVIYANSQKALLIGSIAATLSRRPFVWHLHDILTVADTSRTVHLLARFFGNRFADRVIVNSEATLASYRSIGGTVPATLVYNGIDADQFDPALPAAPRPAGIPDDAPLIGVFSRLTEWKGQHVAIEALRRTKRAHLLLVGGPLFGQQAYEERLRAMVRDLGLSDRVHFVGNQVDVARWMRTCDIVVHSSTLAEPFGRVIVEGMLSHRPVIATDAGGVREIVRDGVNGLLVAPGDAGQLGDAITRLLDEPALAHAMADVALEDARRRFSVERYRREIKAVLTEAAGR
jgi:glycosyltransferase involved in cell wall biosynthesis